MSWHYKQSTGDLFRDEEFIATGYSGFGWGKNNPEAEQVHDIGPIPRGGWVIVGPPIDTVTHGPYVLTLTPKSDTDTFGRTGFRIHGDSVVDPGSASRGCVIFGRIFRENIWESEDLDFEVFL